MAVKQKITLDYLIANNKPIYIRHNALKANLLLILELKDKHGQKQPVRMPPTMVPINLTERFSYSTIQDSDQLRDLLQKQVIVLLDPEEALAYIKANPDEIKAVGVSAYADSAAPNASRDGLEQLKEESEYGAIMSSTDLGNDLSSEEAIQPKIMGIVASLETGEKSAKETLAALKAAKHIMSEVDMNYILTKCKKEKQIRDFIESLRAEMQ